MVKDATDNRTMELNYPQPTPTPKDKPTYMFYIEYPDGERTEWRGLTATKARQMHAYTDQSQPGNVIRYGWEEET